jgi:hypothetical protein
MALNLQGHPLSRTYGANLQSSLTSVLPSALDFSSRLPVSVLVRSLELQPLGAFLGRLADDFPNINAVETTRRLAGADLPFPHRLIGCGRF